MRFSLFAAAGARPILAVGNDRSKVYFWDLQSLEEWEGEDPAAVAEEGAVVAAVKPMAGVGTRGRGRVGGRKGVARAVTKREESIASSSVTGSASAAGGGKKASTAAQKFAVDDPFRALRHHEKCTVPKVTFAVRQIAWSVGGEWMVAVGDQGMVALFKR